MQRYGGAKRILLMAVMALGPQDLGGPEFGDVLSARTGTRVTRTNELQLLVDGAEFESAVFETIAGARRFLSVSFLDYFSDRAGRRAAEAMVARKMGITPEALAELAGADDLYADPLAVKRRYLLKLRDEGQLPDTEVSGILNETDRVYEEAARAFELRIYLDLYHVRLATWLPVPLPWRLPQSADSSGHHVIPMLRSFGAEVVYQPSLFLFVNHMKLLASESEAIVSGANVQDKTFSQGTPELVWHDVSVRVRGPLVDDLNAFYIDQFNRRVGASNTLASLDFAGRLLHLYKGEPATPIDPGRETDSGDLWYFPRANIQGPGASEGRIVVSLSPQSNEGSVNGRSGRNALEAVVQGANQYIAFENAFFSDEWIAKTLIKKARAWNLPALKRELGERLDRATCDPSVLERRKGILLILPKDMDQPVIAWTQQSLLNGMLNAGIDICRWSSDLFMQHKPADDPRAYRAHTMMHSKVWVADGIVSYVGTANLTVRSRRGDLELGVLSRDRAFAENLMRRVMLPDLRDSVPVESRRRNFIFAPLRWALGFIGLI